jgi:hypothetical protein
MKQKPKYKTSGQALLEYLIVFTFMSFISVAFVKAFAGYLGNTVGGLGYYLSQYLTTGACSKSCFGNPYQNKVE